MEEDARWLLPENLKAAEEKARRQARLGILDPRDDFSSYYAYRTGANRDWIRAHAIADDAEALAYARTLRGCLKRRGCRLEGQMLDVGCATGAITEALRRLNPSGRSIGLDLSQDGIELARERYPGCVFHRSSAEDLEVVSEGSCDLIHAREFYPFTRTNDSDYQAGYLRLFAGKLKARGLLVFQTPSSGRGLSATFPRLREIREELGYSRALREPAVPLRISLKLGGLIELGSAYAVLALLGSALGKALGAGRDFYLFQRAG